MKRLTLNLLLVGIAASAWAQGQIAFDNVFNTSHDPAATANGLFWLAEGGTLGLINQDFNAALYGGPDSNTLSLVAILLLSNGTAAHDNDFGPGTLADPAGYAYTVPGSSPFSAFFRVQAWTGNFNSYGAAISGGAATAQSSVFLNPVSVSPGTPPDLVNMPAMVLSGIPEPSAFALAALGGLCALLLWRWRKKVAAAAL